MANGSQIGGEDNRGQAANAILIFGVALVTISLLVIVMNPFMADLEGEALALCAESPGASSAPCTTGMGWVADFWKYFAFVGVFIAILGFIRASSVGSRGPPGGGAM